MQGGLRPGTEPQAIGLFFRPDRYVATRHLHDGHATNSFLRFLHLSFLQIGHSLDAERAQKNAGGQVLHLRVNNLIAIVAIGDG